MADGHIQVIKAPAGWMNINWPELWFYRELFGFLIWRDIKVKYKQTLLGAAWAILVPLLQMVVFTVIFGNLAKLSTDGLPSPIFYYAALLPWTYFASSLNMATQSMVGNAHILTKIYFPRLMIPATPCVAGLIDFFIAFSLLIFMMLYYQISLSITALLLPVLLIIALGTCYGVSLFLSALNVRYRDIRYVIPFLIQMWMYCTVIIPFSAIPESFGNWRYLYGINPMAGVIEGFRWCLLQSHMHVNKVVNGVNVQTAIDSPWILIFIGAIVMICALIFGLMYFKRMERTLADII
ncbi:MAG: ABC transporter permease [Chlamydiota bacterium]|nr:ABC transporter permease [Chlamydiota bacterium]